MDKVEKKKTNKKFILIISAMVLAGIIIGGYMYIHSLSHEETNDAQIMANMIPVIPHVSGYISKVYVKDYQQVKKGDTLFKIDTQDYAVQLAQAKAALASAKSQLAVAQASIGTSKAHFSASKSHVASALGNIDMAKIKLRRTTNDYERYKNLYQNHSITKQKYEQALAAMQQAQEQVDIMKSQKQSSISQRTAANSQTEITEKQVAVAQAQVESAKAMVRKAKLDMSYTMITAPFNGRLSEVSLKPGRFVAPGQSLFYLVNTEHKWVVANFKETQLTDIQEGQAVNIHVDAYPAVKFKGQVAAFSPATGARFSLLPPDNATGNFVKTVQRLPVKIILTAENDPKTIAKLKSGMNVEVDVLTK